MSREPEPVKRFHDGHNLTEPASPALDPAEEQGQADEDDEFQPFGTELIDLGHGWWLDPGPEDVVESHADPSGDADQA